uniref:Uncharacterized protein n=1 Tax=Mycena chlorophos TaxID=658473 RepID=A0ABQ0M161_MYCCL|nr:predicted protein [Mycena chlorophos]
MLNATQRCRLALDELPVLKQAQRASVQISNSVTLLLTSAAVPCFRTRPISWTRSSSRHWSCLHLLSRMSTPGFTMPRVCDSSQCSRVDDEQTLLRMQHSLLLLGGMQSRRLARTTHKTAARASKKGVCMTQNAIPHPPTTRSCVS